MISDELKVLGVIEGPVHANPCEHKDDEYVCSFEYTDRRGDNGRWFSEQIDMYVVSRPGDQTGQSVCLRFGNEPSEYYSGPLQMILNINHDPYRTAIALLWALGSLRWGLRWARKSQ